ncbi:hypothetical protein F6X40_10000 [Paraburkholderia sp. UCT31]|uniref:hypothetical protein n=1 Tax=Paraburkholderia sp. UCT31 TaxID=2615209 RepID=UPI001654E0D8|nr:hypothetical protein [Paraburkholderia sp. UCT31]MBC8737139.1 hypothetical protein [Paraburkholderia sp. UCT31]
MVDMPESWRGRWCQASLCACLGGANCSGKLSAHGFTEADWLAWKEQNPEKIVERRKSSAVVVVLPRNAGIAQAYSIENPPEVADRICFQFPTSQQPD